MAATLTTIRLYGRMGAMFGRVHRVHLDSNSVAEAISYLCSQFPKAREYLLNAKDKGVGFAVFRGKENLTDERLRESVGNEEIRIAPIILGSKNGGVLNIILGVVLIVVGVIGNMYGGWGTPFIQAGIGVIAGGVVQLLSPTPHGLKNSDGPQNDPSFSFAGPVNTQAQGNPVPVGYGRMIVGSAVISAGIVAEDYAPATAGVGPGTPGGSNKKNFYEIEA